MSGAAIRQGVILAAGRGSRLRPLSESTPKPLQPVCNQPVMFYQIEAMRAAGIEDIAIVIGATGGPIVAAFGDGSGLGVRIHYIEDSAPAGIAASLLCARPWVHGPFAVFLGDIFLAIDDLRPALLPLAHGAAATIVTRHDSLEAVRRNFAVITHPNGQITRVIEKPSDPPTSLKGCGVYVFDETIFDAITRTPRSALRNEYEITDSIQTLIDMGRPVYSAEVVRWDINITYPEDLLRCNLRVLRERYAGSVIAAEARVSKRATVSASVVGPRAVIDAPITLDECLVLPDSTVTQLRGMVRHRIFGQMLPAQGLAMIQGRELF